MSRFISPGQVGLSLGTLFVSYFFHHKHQIRIAIDMEPRPSLPDLESDPPPSLVDPKLEDQITDFAKSIEKYADKKRPVKITDQLEYKGDYKKKDGKIVPNGKGVYYANDSQYRMIGTFKEGEVDGPGIFRYPEGMLLKTHFKNGQIDGPGVKYFGDVKFEGNLVNGSPSGTGVYTFRDGTQIFIKRENGKDSAQCYNEKGKLWYKGDFKEGRCHGKGVFFYPDGRKYEGEFSGGRKDGEGKMLDENGDVLYSGKFSEDKPLGWSMYSETAILLGVAALNVARFVYKR